MAGNEKQLYREPSLSTTTTPKDINIWSVLKGSVGKELSKVTMPVVLNEPLSFLQRLTEYMEYHHLLDTASEQQSPLDRLKYVSAFAVSALASNWQRMGKPFNPLLGETYELEHDGFRIVCEQVSHHPPISAFHAENDNWLFHGSIHPKLKFWGKSAEIQPKGTVTLVLLKWKEAYTWSNVNCCIHNIIVGRLWMEQYGTMEIQSHSTSLRSVITFKNAGSDSKDLHRIEGFIADKNKKLLHLYGKWTDFVKSTEYVNYEEYTGATDDKAKSPSHSSGKMIARFNSLKMSSFRLNSTQEPDDVDARGDIPRSESLYSIDIPHSEVLWQANARASTDAYQMTQFAMTLNELTPTLRAHVCPTDSRLRPDIRCLETGDVDGAAAMKTRLEEKQRNAKKTRRGAKKDEWCARWFCHAPNPYTKQEDWLFLGKYWQRNFDDCPDIF